MAGSRRSFSREYREEAAKLVIETGRPIAQVAKELGVGEVSLGKWVKDYRAAQGGDESPLDVSERARLRELEREARDLRLENEFLKKSCRVLCQGSSVSDRFEFIDAQHAAADKDVDVSTSLPVTRMCRILDVSRSGFYEWRTRPMSGTAARRGELSRLVVGFFEASDGTYGYRRIHADLVAQGVECGPELVRQVMRELGLRPCQPRPWRFVLTAGDGQVHDVPDLVRRDFTAAEPGRKAVGDITYIPTDEGWLYLATVIDCHTKAVTGWAMDDNYKTPLIETAIHRAVRNGHLTDNAIFHSDRGSNYTSATFAATLASLHIRQSVGRTGICYDNAPAESFFATLKNELVHRTRYPTREHARRDIARYIELRYNSRRRHSALGYRTPREVHHAYHARKSAIPTVV
ncbi:IS3 family transposase [Actinokineospora auranticolor]|nr:IS3 family transposase [Actinokineospora auranticolor]